jgi:hypothetical protein
MKTALPKLVTQHNTSKAKTSHVILSLNLVFELLTMTNKRQGEERCDLLVGRFGNPYGPTVQRGKRTLCTSGTLSVDVVFVEKRRLIVVVKRQK